MYHLLIRRRLHRVFQHLSTGNYEYALSQMSERFEHLFSGNHPLGGTRHTLTGFRRWFKRLYQLFPDLRFEIKNIFVNGWPWNTVAVVEWIDRATLADGQPYINKGVHVIGIRWGRVTSLHVYLDTQVIMEACQRLALAGVSEAKEALIVD